MSTSVSLDSNVVKLYILDHSFVILKQQDILEISFDGTIKSKDEFTPDPNISSYEFHGIVGLLDGFTDKYLVMVSQVQQRGLLFGHSTYAIEKTICIPMNASVARKTLALHGTKTVMDTDGTSDIQTLLIKEPDGKSGTDTSTTTITSLESQQLSATTIPIEPTITTTSKISTTKVSSPSFMNVLKKTFSSTDNKAGNNSSSTSNLQTSLSAGSFGTRISSSASLSKDFPEPVPVDVLSDSMASVKLSEDTVALEQRLIKEVTNMFSRGMFIFAHGFDITNSIQHTFEKKKDDSTRSILETIDHRFWWNEHLLQDFVKAKLDHWILPIMQGTIQIESCEIDGFPFTFGLVSRRSRERAGLRYQRRGVNDEGQVANFVETEQIVIFKRENVQHIASFVQTRGSIPLFWSQSPYALHPDPALHRSEEENTEAFEKHFQKQESLYGRQVVVNLTELSGREAIIGSEYRYHIEKLGDPNIKYVEFDFHKETKGMRFENISKLSDSLYDNMMKMAYFWEGDNKTVYCEQAGVFRTNCMDCLDRTNVVQSAFARKILNLQLMRFGISEYPDKGIKYYEQFERIFNNVWANNGDMISRMYTGTSALKGDFTRTGKRNFTGIMNDASNSLARMYFNTVKDFWGQATIDYILGYHKLDIFRRIPESSQRSAEPGIEKWLEKIRNDAIQVSCEIVIADDEVKLRGWTLLAPKENKNGKRSSKRFEEKVVLLTSKALYVCSYNYHLEKVVQFKRVELCTIQSIQVGEYILSSLAAESRDPNQNYGLCIYYNSNGQIMRWNTGSLINQNLEDLNITTTDARSKKKKNKRITTSTATMEDSGMESDSSCLSRSSSSSSLSSSSSNSDKDVIIPTGQSSLLFKAVRYNVSGDMRDTKLSTCKEQVEDIVNQIMKQSGQAENARFIVYKPIISLSQAEKTDGLFKKMGYKLKHAIWI